MAVEIAKIRLAAGRVGFYDDATRIHLTISRPEAVIYAGMNTTNIKRAVHSKSLRLVAGSLDVGPAKVEKDMHIKETAAKAPEPKEAESVTPVVEPVKEEAQVEAPKAEEAPIVVEATEAVVEPVVEIPEVAEAPAEEEKKEAQKKTSRRKKAEELETTEVTE